VIGRGRNLSERRDRLRLDVKSTEPRRLDSYLVESLPWKSRNRLQKLIREQGVTVNGEPAKASRRVRAGDVIDLHLSPGVDVPADYDERTIETIYEDEWLLAVSKPPNMLVHPVGKHVYDTLINYLHFRYHETGKDGDEVTPRLCHRLDRDTTGVLVVAKSAYVHRDVMFQFENRLVRKRYSTVVEGRFPDTLRRIAIPIGEGRCLRSALEHDMLRSSETLVEVVRALDDHSVLRCSPSTGRQNQIRVHLAAVGHPVVGDTRYGAMPTAGHPARSGWPSRYLLHAEFLRFWHPRLHAAVEISAPPPADFPRLE